MTIELGGTSPRAQASASISTFEAGSTKTNTNNAQTPELRQPLTPRVHRTEHRPDVLTRASISTGIWQDLLDKLRTKTVKLVQTLLGSGKYATDDEVECNATGVRCMKENIVKTTIMQNGKSVDVKLHANKVELSWSSVAKTVEDEEPPKKTYLVGQSPIPQATSASNFSGSGCEKFLLQGIDSGAGTFQFVSPPRPGNLVNWSSRSIISQLQSEIDKHPDQLPVLGGRYQVNALESAEKDRSLQHQHYRLTVTDVIATPQKKITIVLTQAGLNFDGKLLRADEIRRASAIMDSHKALTGPLSPEAEEPMIVSHAGVGRNATLVLYRELSARIRASDFRENYGGGRKLAMDSALEELIMQGRAARGPGFVHSEAQVRELADTLLEDAMEYEAKLTADESADILAAMVVQASAGPARTQEGYAFVIPDNNLRNNFGGGNCLFHAIAGTRNNKNLDEDKILDLRKKTAGILRGKEEKDRQQLKNADRDTQKMIENRQIRQLQRNRHAYDMISESKDLPELPEDLPELPKDLPELPKDLPKLSDTRIVSNERLAEIIEEGGTYADDMEIELWLELLDNQKKSVVVIDGQSGSESIISFRYDKKKDEVVRIARELKSQEPPWSEEVARREIKASIADALAEETQERNSGVPITRKHLALYRTFKHWEAIINYE